MSGDNLPNYQVEQQRIKVSIIQQQLNVQNCIMRKLEATDTIKKSDENILSHQKAIEDYEAKLKELEATHGNHTTEKAVNEAVGKAVGKA